MFYLYDKVWFYFSPFLELVIHRTVFWSGLGVSTPFPVNLQPNFKFLPTSTNARSLLAHGKLLHSSDQRKELNLFLIQLLATMQFSTTLECLFKKFFSSKKSLLEINKISSILRDHWDSEGNPKNKCLIRSISPQVRTIYFMLSVGIFWESRMFLGF